MKWPPRSAVLVWPWQVTVAFVGFIPFRVPSPGVAIGAPDQTGIDGPSAKAGREPAHIARAMPKVRMVSFFKGGSLHLLSSSLAAMEA